MRIALCQLPVSPDPSVNLARVHTALDEAASGGASLAVFPEATMVRFGGDKEQADAVYAGMQPLTADDIAGAIYWAAAQPPHVNVNRIELMATAQSFAPFQVTREG